jgi:predicted Zn-dependent protease
MGATALPNGVVVVFSETFEVLRNESQLASVLGHEVSHVVQKHLWRLSRMPESDIKTGYRRAFENQADRQALSMMLAAGYDPREAAATWRLMAKKLGFSPLRGSHENYAVRRAFMMHELDTAYRDQDFSGLRIEDARFNEIAGRVKKPY